MLRRERAALQADNRRLAVARGEANATSEDLRRRNLTLSRDHTRMELQLSQLQERLTVGLSTQPPTPLACLSPS